MPEFTSLLISQICAQLSEIIDCIKLFPENLDNVKYNHDYESIKYKLNLCLAKLENIGGTDQIENELNELNILLDECYDLNQSLGQETQIRFLVFQADTQFRNQITMLLDSNELNANTELEAWFKKLFSHYNSIVKRIDLDIQVQLSLAHRFKMLLNSIRFKSTPTASIKESIIQCIDLLRSFSRNELYIIGITPIANYLDLMISVSADKLNSYTTLNSSVSSKQTSYYSKRNTIIEALKHSIKQNHDNYKEQDFNTPDELFEKDKFINDNDLRIGKYLKDYVQYSIGVIIDRLIVNLNIGFITKEYRAGSGLNYYREETITARKEIKRRLSSNLYAYIQLIKTRINTNFNTFDAYLLTEQRLIELLYQNLSSIDQKIVLLKHLITYNN